jgi:hypothetical protein
VLALMSRHCWALIAIVLVPSSLRAQSPAQRSGLWFGFGAGVGQAGSSCQQCLRASSLGGTSAFVKAGATVNPQVRLGAAIHSWWGAAATMGDVRASAYYYPVVTSGFFLTGGLGVSHYSGSAISPPACAVHICKDGAYPTCAEIGYDPCSVPGLSGTGGWGLTAGLGFDLPVTRAMSLSVVGDYVYGALGNVPTQSAFPDGSTSAKGWKQHVIELGLGVTYH